MYLVGVREGATFKFYINGVLERENTSATIGSPDNTHPLNIGRFWTAASFNGSLDEIRISKSEQK